MPPCNFLGMGCLYLWRHTEATRQKACIFLALTQMTRHKCNRIVTYCYTDVKHLLEIHGESEVYITDYAVFFGKIWEKEPAAQKIPGSRFCVFCLACIDFLAD